MPRVHHIKKAAKDHMSGNTILVQKGESYYWWKFRYGGKHISMDPPKPWQLTQSEFLQAVYLAQDQIDNLDPENMEDLDATVDAIKEGLEALRDETQERSDNLSCYGGLSEGPVAVLLEERIRALEYAINQLEIDFDNIDADAAEGDFKDDWMDDDPPTDEDLKEYLKEQREERLVKALEEIQSISIETP